MAYTLAYLLSWSSLIMTPLTFVLLVRDAVERDHNGKLIWPDASDWPLIGAASVGWPIFWTIFALMWLLEKSKPTRTE